MTEQVMGLVDELYEMRLESLLSVQDLVEAVVEALEVRTHCSYTVDHSFPV